jgi:hypothetical protein
LVVKPSSLCFGVEGNAELVFRATSLLFHFACYFKKVRLMFVKKTEKGGYYNEKVS